MTEQKVRTRIRLKPIIFIASGVVALSGLLWLSGFFGNTLNIFVNSSDIRHQRGLRDAISQGTDALITQGYTPIKGQPEILSTDPKIGTKTPSLKIVVFGSLTSGYTAGAFDLIGTIRTDYPDTVQVVWKDLFDQSDKTARDLAIAAHCANRQSKFWEFLDGVFNQTGGLPNVVIDDVAKKTGLDMDSFHACLPDAEIAKQIDNNLTEANRLRVRDVPVWFIGDQPIDGLFPYGQLKNVIEDQLP